MNRRDFLKISIRDVALLSLGYKMLYDTLQDEKVKTKNQEYYYENFYLRYFSDMEHNITNKIYNKLPECVYMARTQGTLNQGGQKKEIMNHFCGFSPQEHPDHFYALEHCIEGLGNYKIKVPIIEKPVTIIRDVENQRETVNGYPLERLVNDSKKDVAIFGISKKARIKRFPCEPRREKLGEIIYMIGNPRLTGPNVRRGRVSDVDEIYSGNLTDETHFGIDIPVIVGDSGTPVVSSDFKLLGLSAISFMNALGYVKRIEEFTKYEEEL